MEPLEAKMIKETFCNDPELKEQIKSCDDLLKLFQLFY